MSQMEENPHFSIQGLDLKNLRNIELQFCETNLQNMDF